MAVLIKTTGARFDAVAAHIETNHGYETPELTALPVENGSLPGLGQRGHRQLTPAVEGRPPLR